MANTSYLRREVESYIRGRLAEEFGQPLSAQVLTVRPGGRHEFDAVASDRTVVASIKAASGLTSGGRIPAGKIKNCLAELKLEPLNVFLLSYITGMEDDADG